MHHACACRIIIIIIIILTADCDTVYVYSVYLESLLYRLIFFSASAES